MADKLCKHLRAHGSTTQQFRLGSGGEELSHTRKVVAILLAQLAKKKKKEGRKEGRKEEERYETQEKKAAKRRAQKEIGAETDIHNYSR